MDQQHLGYHSGHQQQHDERLSGRRREKSRRPRSERSAFPPEEIRAVRGGGGADVGGRKRNEEGQKPRPYIMEALYDYDPHIYSPNVDVEVGYNLLYLGLIPFVILTHLINSLRIVLP